MSSYDKDPKPNKKRSKGEIKRRKLEKKKNKKRVRRITKDFVRLEYMIYQQALYDRYNKVCAS